MRGLYVHLPFCLKKCSYCDFVSFENCYSYESAYVKALLNEFCAYRGEKIDTVYLGGGTPTSLKTESLTAILDGIHQTFCVEENAEITLECNPKTADKDKFSALLSHGVNRLSIGVQSFDDRVLKTIGRVHSADDAKRSIHDAKEAGFCNISADLMFGIPGQSVTSVKESVAQMERLPVCHISCYVLILEENTPLFKRVENGTLVLPDEDTELLMYRTITEDLKNAGFYQYEISNYAKSGYESRHNLKYWDAAEYIGCGAGAHSYFQGVRFCHSADLGAYLENPLMRCEEDAILPKEQMKEFMILGLRRKAGVSRKAFSARFSKELDACFGHVIERFVSLGLLESNGDAVRFTEDGMYVSNTVLCELM